MTKLRIQLARGEVLFREGEDPGTAFLIESGEIEVRTRQRGRDVILSVLGPGELVGEAVVQLDPARVELHVDFPWARVPGRAGVSREPAEPSEVGRTRRRMRPTKEDPRRVRV